MNLLLNTVDDLIEHLGRAVMAATTDEFLTAYIAQAQDDVLERAIGPEFLAELIALQAGEGEADAKKTIALLKARRVLAWSAYLRYLPYSIGNDGDNGLQELGTENTQPVRIGVLDKRIRETEKNAINALESLLQYLEDNLSDFSTYADSVTGRETRSLFVPSATAMSEFLPQIAGNHRLFLNVKPYIKLAERDYFLPRLGQQQYERLKMGLKDGNLSNIEKDLLFNIRRALAHTAYWIALPHMQFVLLSNGNLRVLSDFDGIYNSKAPDQETIISVIRGAETEAKKWQNALRAFLTRKLEQFPLYAESQASKEQPTNKLPDNSGYTSIFRMK